MVGSLDSVEEKNKLNGTKRKTMSLRSLLGNNVVVKQRDGDVYYGKLEFNNNPALGNEGYYVNGKQITINSVSRVFRNDYTIELYPIRLGVQQ